MQHLRSPSSFVLHDDEQPVVKCTSGIDTIGPASCSDANSRGSPVHESDLTLCPFQAYSLHPLKQTSYADTHRQHVSAIPA